VCDEPPLFVAIAEFCLARGFKRIRELPGCCEVQVDDHWWIAVNGHPNPSSTSRGTSVPAFSAYVEFNGWPAGLVDAGGSGFAAGALANPQTFRAALARALS